jgi:hypothetical protein
VISRLVLTDDAAASFVTRSALLIAHPFQDGTSTIIAAVAVVVSPRSPSVRTKSLPSLARVGWALGIGTDTIVKRTFALKIRTEAGSVFCARCRAFGRAQGSRADRLLRYRAHSRSREEWPPAVGFARRRSHVRGMFLGAGGVATVRKARLGSLREIVRWA